MGIRSHTTRVIDVTTTVAPVSDLPDHFTPGTTGPGEYAVILADSGNCEEFVIAGSLGALAEILRQASAQIEQAVRQSGRGPGIRKVNR